MFTPVSQFNKILVYSSLAYLMQAMKCEIHVTKEDNCPPAKNGMTQANVVTVFNLLQ